MAESSMPGGIPPKPPDHLSVRGEGPGEPTMFAFGQQRQRMLPSMAGALVLYGLVGGLLLVLGRFGVPIAAFPPVLPEEPNDQIVWLSQPGPGGGGGGGGNKAPEPPRAAQLPGKEKISVPAVKPPAIEPEPKPKPEEPPPLQEVNIPAKTLGASADILPGAIAAPTAPPTASLGSGTGTGAGTGAGSGIGAGTGSGLGQGSGGGTGGGVYRPGNGVTTPRLIAQVKPQYTSEAMRAKVQGTVLLQCVVQTDGSITDVRVIRSLDNTFGLDQEAIKAARQWKFAPGTRMGQPVPVEITIELSFSLR
jgi:TonB family protein